MTGAYGPCALQRVEVVRENVHGPAPPWDVKEVLECLNHVTHRSVREKVHVQCQRNLII